MTHPLVRAAREYDENDNVERIDIGGPPDASDDARMPLELTLAVYLFGVATGAGMIGVVWWVSRLW